MATMQKTFSDDALAADRKLHTVDAGRAELTLVTDDKFEWRQRESLLAEAAMLDSGLTLADDDGGFDPYNQDGFKTAEFWKG